jgi:hypothetical protein
MMPKEHDIWRKVLRFFNKGLIVSREQIGKKEEEDDTRKSKKDNDSNGTHSNKVNATSGSKKALKVLHEWKQAWRDESQPSAPIKGADLRSTSDVPSVNALPPVDY